MTREEIFGDLHNCVDYYTQKGNCAPKIESRAFLGIYNCLHITAFNIAFGSKVKEHCMEAIRYLKDDGSDNSLKKAELLCEAIKLYDELCAETTKFIY